MKNKVLIKVIIPELDETYDVFIPVNEITWKVKKLIVKSVFDLAGISQPKNEYLLINQNTGKVYLNNEVVINTDIRNGTSLLLFPISPTL